MSSLIVALQRAVKNTVVAIFIYGLDTECLELGDGSNRQGEA
jgi:hypothetical protein